MNLKESKYSSFALVREMLDTARVVRELPVEKILAFSPKMTQERIFLTGEGSSRIFPSKKVICDALRWRYKEQFVTEGPMQGLDYELDSYSVFVASNSGKTREAVRLIRNLKMRRHLNLFSVVGHDQTPIADEVHASYVLTCGNEEATAATKSVVEQALFYDLLFRHRNHAELPDLGHLAKLIEETLTMKIPEEVVDRLAGASLVYYAGRNNGVSEELTLKTNEIARKKSDFLSGTYAVHGIEEVMESTEAMLVVNPFAAEEGKFHEVIEKGAGVPVFAISTDKTSFPTIVIPDYGEFTPYLELAAGWNLLVEVGIRLGIDLDHPRRARKVGNELK